MKRTPLKRGSSQLKRSPLKRGTSKLNQRGKKASEWESWVRQNPPSDHPCTVCRGEAVTWHHRGQKSTHPEFITFRGNVEPLCWRCHAAVHDDHEGSLASGWLLRSWVVPGSDEDPFTK